MKIIVTGEHSVLGSGDKLFDDLEAAKDYEGGLIHYGFDNVAIGVFSYSNAKFVKETSCSALVTSARG